MSPRPRRSDSIATPLPRPDDLDRLLHRMRSVPGKLSEKALLDPDTGMPSIAMVAGFTT